MIILLIGFTYIALIVVVNRKRSEKVKRRLTGRSGRAYPSLTMLIDDDTPNPLTNLKTYAERMRITTQAVHYQLGKGTCLVAPIVGTKPPKWRTADIDTFLNPPATVE